MRADTEEHVLWQEAGDTESFCARHRQPCPAPCGRREWPRRPKPEESPVGTFKSVC